MMTDADVMSPDPFECEVVMIAAAVGSSLTLLDSGGGIRHKLSHWSLSMVPETSNDTCHDGRPGGGTSAPTMNTTP